jgi:mannose-6-phosphate isomerase-like protein (cupin superfamily)
VETFYILEGHATIEVAGEPYVLAANDAILIVADKPHNICNTGTTLLRYAVMNARV